MLLFCRARRLPPLLLTRIELADEPGSNHCGVPVEVRRRLVLGRLQLLLGFLADLILEVPEIKALSFYALRTHLVPLLLPILDLPYQLTHEVLIMIVFSGCLRGIPEMVFLLLPQLFDLLFL